MTTYLPQTGVFAGRPPCANCGAAYRLHGLAGATAAELADSANRGILACPVRSRIGTLEAATDEYRAALVSEDMSRIFVARGEVQRLGGDPDKITRDLIGQVLTGGER